MGQIRKINDVYYIEFYARGLLYSQVAGQDLETAQQLLADVEEKIAGGEALTIPRYIELPDFFERFIVEARAQGLTTKGISRLAGTIKHFSSFIARSSPKLHQLSQLTPAIMESYKDYLVKSQSAKVANLTILLIRDVLEFGIKLGFINDNPCLHLRLLPWPQGARRKPTARYVKAKQLLSQGIGITKLALLLKITDISRVIYFGGLIPLSREDMYV